jgi:glutathione S-transferase
MSFESDDHTPDLCRNRDRAEAYPFVAQAHDRGRRGAYEQQVSHRLRCAGRTSCRRRAYLTGESFTVVDPYGWATMWHERSGVNLDHLNNLMAYIDRVEARPSVQKALDDEAELVVRHTRQLAA